LILEEKMALGLSAPPPEKVPMESLSEDALAGAFKTKLLDCLEKDDDGGLKMTIAIPDEGMLDNMAQSLAKMVGARL